MNLYNILHIHLLNKKVWKAYRSITVRPSHAYLNIGQEVAVDVDPTDTKV